MIVTKYLQIGFNSKTTKNRRETEFFERKMAASLRTCLEIPKTFIKYVFGEIVDIDQSIEEEKESESNIVKRPIKTFGWEWKRTFYRSRVYF